MAKKGPPEKWTGELIGKMHNAEISQDDIAEEMGVGKAYVSMILHGQRKPDDAKERLNAAFQAILSRKKAQKEAEAHEDQG